VGVPSFGRATPDPMRATNFFPKFFPKFPTKRSLLFVGGVQKANDAFDALFEGSRFFKHRENVLNNIDTARIRQPIWGHLGTRFLRYRLGSKESFGFEPRQERHSIRFWFQPVAGRKNLDRVDLFWSGGRRYVQHSVVHRANPRGCCEKSSKRVRADELFWNLFVLEHTCPLKARPTLLAEMTVPIFRGSRYVLPAKPGSRRPLIHDPLGKY
jgi:hypothetical protein